MTIFFSVSVIEYTKRRFSNTLQPKHRRGTEKKRCEMLCETCELAFPHQYDDRRQEITQNCCRFFDGKSKYARLILIEMFRKPLFNANDYELRDSKHNIDCARFGFG